MQTSRCIKLRITNGHVSYYDSSLDKQQKELFILQHDLAYAVEKNQFRSILSADRNN